MEKKKKKTLLMWESAKINKIELQWKYFCWQAITVRYHQYLGDKMMALRENFACFIYRFLITNDSPLPFSSFWLLHLQ